MKVNNEDINFGVDNGLHKMLISESTYQEKLSTCELTKIAVRTYTNVLRNYTYCNCTIQRKHVYKFPFICYCWRQCESTLS